MIPSQDHICRDFKVDREVFFSPFLYFCFVLFCSLFFSFYITTGQSNCFYNREMIAEVIDESNDLRLTFDQEIINNLQRLNHCGIVNRIFVMSERHTLYFGLWSTDRSRHWKDLYLSVFGYFGKKNEEKKTRKKLTIQ